MYFPFMLRAIFLKVISIPTLLEIFFLRVVINDSRDILYIVRFSIYPFVSFCIKSLGKSIVNLLSNSLRCISGRFENLFSLNKLLRIEYGIFWKEFVIYTLRIKMKRVFNIFSI